MIKNGLVSSRSRTPRGVIRGSLSQDGGRRDLGRAACTTSVEARQPSPAHSVLSEREIKSGEDERSRRWASRKSASARECAWPPNALVTRARATGALEEVESRSVSGKTVVRSVVVRSWSWLRSAKVVGDGRGRCAELNRRVCFLLAFDERVGGAREQPQHTFDSRKRARERERKTRSQRVSCTRVSLVSSLSLSLS